MSSTTTAPKQKAKAPNTVRCEQPSQEARRVAAAILEVLAGIRTPTEAAVSLSVSVPRYYLLEQRALAGMVTNCEPRRGVRTKRPATQIAELELQVQRLQQQCDRHLALARVAGRSVGLATPPKPTRAKQDGDKNPSQSKRRRRRPTVRALKAVEALNVAAEQNSAENGSAKSTNTQPQGD